MTVRRLIIIAFALLCSCAFVVAGCDSTESTTETSGLYPVSVDGKWGYIDKTGAWAIEPAGFDDARSFSEGLAAVSVDGKYGYIDKTGAWVIPLRFDGAGSFSNGLARARLGDRWGYIDKTGRLIWHCPVPTPATGSPGIG
jgi:hypothetical protein